MMTYLEDGRCSFCNNLSEIEVKPVALGRKNYLFSDTAAGADFSAVIYSLVETAKANGLNMYPLSLVSVGRTAPEEKAQKLLED